MRVQKKRRANWDAKFDAALFWILAPGCNLKCAYCIEGGAKYNPDWGGIDTPRLLKTLEQTGRTFNIIFTGGGEPFFESGLTEVCTELVQHHYISIATNMTTKKVEHFSKSVDPARVIYLIASIHYEELERLNLFDRFASNFGLLDEAGFPVYATNVANPNYVSRAEEIAQKMKDLGVPFHWEPYIGVMNEKPYPFSYTEDEMRVFGFEPEDLASFQTLNRMCNAGYNFSVVMQNGGVVLCQMLKTPMGHIFDGFTFNETLIKCPLPFCSCPLMDHDPKRFEIALSEIDG